MLPRLRRGRSVQADVASRGRLVYLPEVWPHGHSRETGVQSEVRRVEPGSLIQHVDPGRAQMTAVAIKKSSREKAVGSKRWGTLRSDGCGEEWPRPASVDKGVAEKQSGWKR